MKPAAYVPPQLWPDTTAPENVPAQVAEVRIAYGQPRVTIYHVAGPLHENARLAAARYAKRGWRVDFTLNPRDLIIPMARAGELRRVA